MLIFSLLVAIALPLLAHLSNHFHWQREAVYSVNTQIRSVQHSDHNCVTGGLYCEVHSISMPQDSCFLDLYVR
ncbi:hypothetical protein [Nostoc sp.]|uniref:hypothetical protein n=1 Tax=Nostoc sp. TaxID=1180 RepID=UPI002FF5F9F2